MGVVFEQAFKPPTMVLLACLLLFVFTTFIMAIYMQNASLVPNLEVSRTWEKFLGSLSGIELCVTPSENETDKLPPIFVDIQAPLNLSTSPDLLTNSNNWISVTVLAHIRLIRSLTGLSQGTLAVAGQVPLGGWSRLCYNMESENALLNISFVYPDNLTESEEKDVCVILSGPRSLLPQSRPSAVCLPPIIDSKETKLAVLTGGGDQTIFNTIRRNRDDCANGTLINLAYDAEMNHIVYLSTTEREKITWNLELVSACLLIFCLLYIILRVMISRRSVFVADDEYGAVSQMT